ncbi:peptidyl-prolyl cis-trans isomerase [Candidatus Dependentiae bacterium]
MTNKRNKKIHKLFLSLVVLKSFAVFGVDQGTFLIDKIETVIYGPQETSIITKSDLEKRSLDGQQRTKDKFVFELLVFQDAKKYNILDEKLVDRYIEAVQAQHNLSLEDLKKMFYDSGYTYEEGREQLAMYNTISQLMDFKVRSKVIIPEKEVKKYYDENPVYQEEAYKLQRVFVPAPSEAGGKQLAPKEIAQKIKIGQVIPEAEYSEPFWTEKPDLAADKMFIAGLTVGQASKPVAYENGFEVFKLLEKRDRQLIPFEERYREIGDTLRAPLFEKLFDDYKKSLFKDSVVVDLP